MLGNYFKKKTPQITEEDPVCINDKRFLNNDVVICGNTVPLLLKIRVYLLLNDFNENEISVRVLHEVRVHSLYTYADVVLTRGKIRSKKTITTYSRYSHPDIHEQVTQLITEFKEKEALYHKLDEYMIDNKYEPKLEEDALQ